MAEPSKHTSRLFLLDRKSGQKFLIDSGSEICVIPPSPTMNKSPQSNFSLFAANNTKIPAYGMVRKELNLGLRRPFIWTFIIADVSSPIIGADFLKPFNLLIDLKKKSNPSLISKSASHGTVHHIITTGPPVTARPRRLHPKLYDAVKVEFEFLLAQGIIRPSKSGGAWSSPLHVVPKSDSTVRPVGDYRQLNSVSEFDSYPMPYLKDFAHVLHGKKIFSKIDIFKAFHQIPIAERFLPKAAEQQYLLSEFLKGSKNKKDSKPLNWSSEAITAFQRCKQALADAALLAHPSPSAPLALHVDASDYAIGGTLHQVVDSELQPLAFFSENLLHLKSLTVPTTVNSLLSTRLSDTFGICWKLEISQCLLTTSPSLMPLGKKVTSVLHGRSISWISSLSSPQVLYTFQDLTVLLLMFSLVFLQSPSQVKLTMTVLLRHNRLIRSFTP
ncbi:retrovirus-related Pol polyprotein from transposon opus [Trichonephila clavipes]|nr:retrovirus-related Pol polyprotein from transposon opus [Trichonephila clavipes]